MSEAVITEAVQKLDEKTKATRDHVTSHFYDDLDPSDPAFFEIVTVPTEDGDVKIFKGFLIAAIRALKKHQKTILEAARDGRDFARKAMQ